MRRFKGRLPRMGKWESVGKRKGKSLEGRRASLDSKREEGGGGKSTKNEWGPEGGSCARQKKNREICDSCKWKHRPLVLNGKEHRKP